MVEERVNELDSLGRPLAVVDLQNAWENRVVLLLQVSDELRDLESQEVVGKSVHIR